MKCLLLLIKSKTNFSHSLPSNNIRVLTLQTDKKKTLTNQNTPKSFYGVYRAPHNLEKQEAYKRKSYKSTINY